MEAVPRMPMIWLDLKEAGEFQFSPSVKQFILKNYGENPENYNEQLKKLETLRQGAVNVTRDFEGCSILRKYFGQLHYLQSRVPLGPGQEAAVPISWTEIFSGKTVTHDDISYEQACILYNLGALHSMLGAMDNRVSEEGMKVSCTHFQCSAGAFSYLRDHFSHNFSVDMSHQILNLNINLMLGQAQECLLEKSMLDNRKSFLVARISAQVVDYYKEACRALENSDTASMLGKIQKDWKKLVQMKIYYFASIAHLHMGKQAEEQQKYGERLAYLQSSLDKLSEAIKLAKGQPDSVQEALRFTMDVIGGKFNSAKKDNDFIYHETVPSLETLASVKGAPLVKALPVNPTDPSVTGPDLFAKLVPMAAHEASSLYSEEKAKLLRDIMAKIESKNETLEQFMDSLGLEPDSVDNLDMYSHIPPVLMEKCAALSVRPDTVKSLIQSMQVLSGVFTDVEASLREIRDVLEEDEAGVRALQEAVGGDPAAELQAQAQSLAEIRRDLEKYMEAHEKASFTNTELHRAMNLHISNLRLLGGPLDALRDALPRPQLNEEEVAGLQCMKRILGKVQEMRDQRCSLEKQLRDLIQHDDITSSLVTTDRADMKRLFEEQLKKYEQVKVYIDQNLSAQENILKALTEANVQYASVRKGEGFQWDTSINQSLIHFLPWLLLSFGFLSLVNLFIVNWIIYTIFGQNRFGLFRIPTSMGQPQPPPQHMIPPPAVAPLVAPPPNAIPPHPSPSPSPSPGLACQMPSPAPTPGGPPSLPSPPSPATSLFLPQNSTDDLLSSSPESQPGGPKTPTNVLQPTKADPQDGERRKKSSQGIRLIQGDPYQAPERVARLCGELERFRLAVEALERPSMVEGSLSALDACWKELQEGQERDARPLSIAIARCYTMKNRHQDVMPYDCNRVLLRSGKDDYINASFVEELSPYCPRLIATQAPLSGTAADFWLMVWEQKVSLVVMLVSEQELDKGKVLRYFPTERGQQLAQGPITVTLTTQKTTPTHVERMIGLQYRDQSLKRTVIHLQFTSWPELGLPESKSNLIHFIQEVHGYYLHQRPLHTPIVVHCSSGVGRTGAFCLLYAAVQELEAGNSIPDLPLLVKKMRQQRKNMLQEKLHLKFCYEAVLKHAEQVLQRHGYLPAAPCLKAPSTAAAKPYSRQESQQDIVLGGDMTISSIQATIAKLSIRPPSATDLAMNPGLNGGAPSGLEDQPFVPSNNLPLDGKLELSVAPASLSPSSPEKVQSLPPNGVDAPAPSSPPTAKNNVVPEVLPDPGPPTGPPPNSLELLASLTPEAFSMEGGGGRGKHRVTKQSFLQPAEGQGLHKGPIEEGGDDPLSSLDPLWSLNKS
uniref:Tyrosine-protein phosphatase non-receptor type 23 n=1 Tax=Esox lucius TaxID=8010 RepID=A0A6Q2YGP9_ESOLU